MSPPRIHRVALFVTCLVDLCRPSVGFAAIKLLAQADAARKCGGLGRAADSRRTTPGTARRRATWHAEFDAFIGYDYVVVPSGSCGGMLRTHLPHLFDHDPNLRARDDELGAKCYELVSFLSDVLKIDRIPTVRADALSPTTTPALAYANSASRTSPADICAKPESRSGR